MGQGQTASIEWWNNTLDEIGIRSMDRQIPVDASWTDILKTGRDDLTRAIAITSMTSGPDRTVVDVGCGVGRVSAALTEHFGQVVGLDIAPRMVEEARRRNDNARVTFEVSDGVRLRPASITTCDTVFSYEVFYYLNSQSLAKYFRDAYELLADDGQLVFQLNIEPIQLKTHLSFLLRKGLYALGIKEWRGWPTGAGIRRYYHSPAWLKKTLTEIGFRVEKLGGPTLRQTWVVAVKPGAMDSSGQR